jgi:predicted nuclease of restriction endonuclease-like (RecB) superfamily
MNIVKTKDFKNFVHDIVSEIKKARVRAYQRVNRQLVELYLFIGKNIYQKVEVSKWGEGIVGKLSEDLKRAFPDMKGFSTQNLWRMKELYDAYKDNRKLSTLVRELPWTHNSIILHQTNSLEEKEFYLKSCINERWSKRELERQIDSSLFERYMLSNKTDNMIPKTEEFHIISHFKEEYSLEFLGLKDDFQRRT